MSLCNNNAKHGPICLQNAQTYGQAIDLREGLRKFNLDRSKMNRKGVDFPLHSINLKSNFGKWSLAKYVDTIL